MTVSRVVVFLFHTAPQYNPLVDIRVHGNSNDTSKYENQHVFFWSIFEILNFQVLADGVKIVEPKMAKMGETPQFNPLVDIRVHGNSDNTYKYEN